MNIFKVLKDIFAPDAKKVYQWCFRCRRITANGSRTVVWYGKKKRETFCKDCNSWKPTK